MQKDQKNFNIPSKSCSLSFYLVFSEPVASEPPTQEDTAEEEEEQDEDGDEEDYHYVYEDEEEDRDSEEKDVKKEKAAIPESQDDDKTLQEVEGQYHTVSFIYFLTATMHPATATHLIHISGPVHYRGLHLLTYFFFNIISEFKCTFYCLPLSIHPI